MTTTGAGEDGAITGELPQVEQIAENLFAATVPDGWQQGRGAFGGLVLGLLARAIEASEPERTRTLRSLSGELVGPVTPGAAAIDVEVLRRGAGASTLSAKLRQGGEVQARATAILGRARADTRTFTELEPPSPPPFDELADAPVGPPFGPVFARRYHYRPTGPLPFTAGPRAVSAGWVRSRRALTSLGVAEVLAYADAWWPAVFARESAPRPMATMAFTLQLCADLATLDPAAPFFHRASAVNAREGYSVELRELWTAAGELVALNQQTFVAIK